MQLKNFKNWFAQNPSSAFVYSPILRAPTGHTYQVNNLENDEIIFGQNTSKNMIYCPIRHRLAPLVTANCWRFRRISRGSAIRQLLAYAAGRSIEIANPGQAPLRESESKSEHFFRQKLSRAAHFGANLCRMGQYSADLKLVKLTLPSVKC